MPVQVDTAHYQAATYEQRERLYSYVEQVSLVSELGGQSVIEVGCGSQVITELLRMRGINVTTVDFDASLKPDVVCGVENILLPDAYAARSSSICLFRSSQSARMSCSASAGHMPLFPSRMHVRTLALPLCEASIAMRPSTLVSNGTH